MLRITSTTTNPLGFFDPASAEVSAYTNDGMTLPKDARPGPNCGVTAIAVASGMSFGQVWGTVRPFKSSRWRGALTTTEILHLARLCCLHLREVEMPRNSLGRRARHQLRIWHARKNLFDPKKRYLVLTTKHAQVVKGDYLIDQGGKRKICATDRMSRKIATNVYEIVE